MDVYSSVLITCPLLTALPSALALNCAQADGAPRIRPWGNTCLPKPTIDLKNAYFRNPDILFVLKAPNTNTRKMGLKCVVLSKPETVNSPLLSSQAVQQPSLWPPQLVLFSKVFSYLYWSSFASGVVHDYEQLSKPWPCLSAGEVKGSQGARVDACLHVLQVLCCKPKKMCCLLKTYDSSMCKKLGFKKKQPKQWPPFSRLLFLFAGSSSSLFFFFFWGRLALS